MNIVGIVGHRTVGTSDPRRGYRGWVPPKGGVPDPRYDPVGKAKLSSWVVGRGDERGSG